VEKPAPVDHPVHDLLRRRWSPRAFTERAVSPADLASLLEAARWSPSCFNDQPWSFLLGLRGDETWQGIADVLVEKNRLWAAAAPVLMISMAHENFVQTGKPNRWAQYDAGQAVAHLTFEATARGLFVHQMGGFDAEAARRRFQIPPAQTPLAAIALGYPGDPDALPEPFAAREREARERVSAREFTFARRWGTPVAWPPGTTEHAP
jgi:nitroreductase